MKANYRNRQPDLKTYIEFNQRFGKGYQARLVMAGVIDSVLDTEPFTIEGCTAGLVSAVEEINLHTGYTYKPREVMEIRVDALKANGDYERLLEHGWIEAPQSGTQLIDFSKYLKQ